MMNNVNNMKKIIKKLYKNIIKFLTQVLNSYKKKIY